MRKFIMDKNNWIHGVSDGLSCSCEKCGKYPIKWDYGVEDWLWKRVVPKKWQSSVVCLECFEKLCIETGNLEFFGECIRFVQYTAFNQTIELIPVNLFVYEKDRS